MENYSLAQVRVVLRLLIDAFVSAEQLSPAASCLRVLLLDFLAQLNNLEVALLRSRSCEPGSFNFTAKGDVQPSVDLLVVRSSWKTLTALKKAMQLGNGCKAIGDVEIAKHHEELRYVSFTVKCLLDLATPKEVTNFGADTTVDVGLPNPTIQSLQGFLHRFFKGLQPALGAPYSSKAEDFPSEGSSEAGAFVHRKLKKGLKTALLLKGEVIWRIKHTFYWLLKAEDIRPDRHDVGAIQPYRPTANDIVFAPEVAALVALVKAAWLITTVPLLDDFRDVPPELKTVVNYLQKKVMDAVNSLYDSSSPPCFDYDTLESGSVWGLAMPGDAVYNPPARVRGDIPLEIPSRQGPSLPPTSPHYSPDIRHREHQYYLDSKASKSKIPQKPKQGEDSSRSRRRSEDENLPGSSNIPKLKTWPQESRAEPIFTYAVDLRASAVPPLRSSSPADEHQIPTSSSNTDSFNDGDRFPPQEPRRIVSDNERESTNSRPAGSLLVFDLENIPHPLSTTPVHPTSMAEDTPPESTGPASNEIEVFNVETTNEQNPRGDSFTRIFTRDYDSLDGDQYILSKVRVFKDRSTLRGEYLRLWIRRPNRLIEMKVGLGNTELVPTYAFNFESQSKAAILNLRESGSDAQVGFKFQSSSDEGASGELYGFQCLLLGAFFEKDYPIARVSMMPRKGLAECATLTRFQIWKEAPPTLETNIDESMWSMKNVPFTKSLGGWQNYILDFGYDDLFSIKIFFYVMHTVFVLIISDRFVIQTVRNSTGLQETVDILPNKTESSSFIRLGVLSGNRTKPAGIPLDQAGIRYSDQDAKGCFQDYSYIRIEFYSEKDRIDFLNDIEEYREDWKKQCAPFKMFRAMQRDGIRRTGTTWERGEAQTRANIPVSSAHSPG